MHMRALVLDRLGPPSELRLAEVAALEPGPGELRIAVRAAGLNPADYKIMERGAPGWAFPKVMGLDCAGEAEALGPGVSGFAVGDRVATKSSFVRLGAYAERFTGPAHVVWKLPDAVSFEAAAALPTAGLTAYQIVRRRLRLKPGETVVVVGAAGGVGGFALQLAKLAGCEVVAVASEANHAEVKRLGAAHAVDYRGEDVAARVKALTGGRGADAVIDLVGPESAGAGLDMLAHGGALACVAGVPPAARLSAFPRGVSVHDIALGFAFVRADRLAEADLATMGAELCRLVAAGALDPQVSEVVAFDDIPAALERLAGRHVRGKIVARIG
jgi:NADPH:quinone reductase-like Zn-dependent oxidoreductase